MNASVLYAVLEGVLRKVRLVAKQENTMAWGLTEDLVELPQRVERFLAFLQGAEDRGRTNEEPFKYMLQNLGKALIDLENMLDDYLYGTEGNKVVRGTMNKVRNFFSSSNPLVIRSRMAPMVEGIKLLAKLINEFHENPIEFLEGPFQMYTASSARRDRLRTSYILDEEIVGRDDDIEKIVSITCSYRENLSVIGIVGMAGQGKTAVARQLRNHGRVKSHFEINIWTSVGYGENLETVPTQMYQILTEENPPLTNRGAMLDILRRRVYGKRCLIVLDDVWDAKLSNTWDELKKMLGRGSTIIITSRDVEVVKKMGGFVYCLGALSEEESQKLFEKIAFAHGKAMKRGEFLDMSKIIVNNCEGLPLAIQVVGRLLRSTEDVNEWSKIAEADTWVSFDGSTQLLSSIKLSFDALPSSSLKHCFAYCAIFPKGSIIERKALIQQWVALGFLLPRSEQPDFEGDPEDIGREYFQALLQKSLFQSVEFDAFGDVESCKMHSLMHAVASEASKGYCLTVEDGSTIGSIQPVHLYITANGGQSIDSYPTEKLSGLRTLFLHGVGLPKDLPSKCKYLRVFVVRDLTVKKLPDSISRLKFLAYLDIVGTRIRTLPPSIIALKKLQTLRVSILLELPRNFHELFLRHLHIQTKYHLLLPGISRFFHLQTLSYFAVNQEPNGCQIGELSLLRQLEGSLSLYNLENVSSFEEAAKADLVSKLKIMNLEFHWSFDLEEDFDYMGVIEGLKPPPTLKSLKIVKFGGESFPQWISSQSEDMLVNLVTITLKDINRCEQVPPLGHLPLLKVVNIIGMERVKRIGIEFYGPAFSPFPSLKCLTLENMPNLEEWYDPSYIVTAFHVLETLKVSGTPRLRPLPEFSRKPPLKKLRVYECNSLSYLPEDLPSIEELELFLCSSLVSIPRIWKCRNLRRLAIWRCNKLTGLPAKLGECTKLEELEIDRCSSIRLEDIHCPINLRKLRLSLPRVVDYEDFPWPREPTSFPSLEYLFLKGTSKIRSLPEQIQNLPALKELIIEEFHQIDELPEWLCNIKSLRPLRVSYCRKLAQLPSRKALQRLTASCEVIFLNCPILKEKCEEERSQEWDKIAGIINIQWWK